jgi:hypothetical protein
MTDFEVRPQWQHPTNEDGWKQLRCHLRSQTFDSEAGINSKRPTTVKKQLSVDERIHRFWGWVSFRDYSPQKPSKYGMKLFILAQSSPGYIWNEVYHKDPELDTSAARAVECLLSQLTKKATLFMSSISTPVLHLLRSCHKWTLALKRQ